MTLIYAYKSYAYKIKACNQQPHFPFHQDNSYLVIVFKRVELSNDRKSKSYSMNIHFIEFACCFKLLLQCKRRVSFLDWWYSPDIRHFHQIPRGSKQNCCFDSLFSDFLKVSAIFVLRQLWINSRWWYCDTANIGRTLTGLKTSCDLIIAQHFYMPGV